MLFASLVTSSALACGGFFCDAVQPVVQDAEVVVFSVDEDAGPIGETTMHVQVSYEGPPTEFAWVLPVRGTPELQLSSQALFDAIIQQTGPT